MDLGAAPTVLPFRSSRSYERSRSVPGLLSDASQGQVSAQGLASATGSGSAVAAVGASPGPALPPKQQSRPVKVKGFATREAEPGSYVPIPLVAPPSAVRRFQRSSSLQQDAGSATTPARPQTFSPGGVGGPGSPGVGLVTPPPRPAPPGSTPTTPSRTPGTPGSGGATPRLNGATGWTPGTTGPGTPGSPGGATSPPPWSPQTPSTPGTPGASPGGPTPRRRILPPFSPGAAAAAPVVSDDPFPGYDV